MKLLTLNIDDKRFISLAKRMSDGKGDEVLFVDWIPLLQPVTHKAKTGKVPVKNLDVIQSTPSDVRLVIFDRYSSLTKSDVDHYLKRNSILLEPVLRPRPGFLFMPYWVNKLDLPLSVWDNERVFHAGFKDPSSRIECVSKIVRYSTIDGIRIGVDTGKMPDDAKKIIHEIASVGKFHWNQFHTTLITGSENDYNYGTIPDIRSHLEYGVVPIVSNNHKWFHALFKNFIEFDISTMEWYYRMNKKISGYGFMDELYKNINQYLPEMFTENFIQTVIPLCKK